MTIPASTIAQPWLLLIHQIPPKPDYFRVKVGRRLVARPTVAADDRPVIDIAALIEEERNRWP